MALRHKGLFALIVVLCISGATLITFMMPKIYRAETVLLVEGERFLNPLINGIAISPSVQGRMRTLRDELLSWERLTLLVEKLELDKEVKTPVEYEKLINDLREKISIRLRGTDIITIAHEGAVPKDSQNVVQTLSDIIIEGNLTSADLEANSAIRFIEEQLDSYRTKLEASEKKLREFKEIYSSTLPVAVRLNEQLVGLKMQLNNLMVDNTEEHPRVIQTKGLIEQVESQRDQYIKQAQKDGADIGEAEYARLVSSVPLQEQQLSKLKRDYSINEGIYQGLLQRLETAKISQTLESSDNGTKFRILEPARLPLVPVKPNKPLFILGGLFVGIGLGAVVIYLIELSNTSFRTVDEARKILQLPIFAAISTIRPEELLVEERLEAKVGV